MLQPNYIVHAQVSLGEVLKCGNDHGFRAINAKRADFLVTDQGYMPVALVEYHGSGHFKGDYRERDLIKQMAAEKAGLKYIALFKTDEADIKKSLVTSGLAPALEHCISTLVLSQLST